MQDNHSTWRQVYLKIKQAPEAEHHMLTSKHPAVLIVSRLRSSHYPTEVLRAATAGGSNKCRVCSQQPAETMQHFLLECPAYTHRQLLQQQLARVVEAQPPLHQQYVTAYFTATLASDVQCARLLSRTVPPPPTGETDKQQWTRLWQAIFNALNIFCFDMHHTRLRLMQHHTTASSVSHHPQNAAA